MADGNRVIATGGIPGGSTWAQAGAQAGQGFGQGIGQGLSQRMMLGQQSRQLNPLREMLLSQLQGMEQPSLQHQMIAQAAQDPRQFAQLVGGSPAGAIELAGQIQPQVEPVTQRVNVTGDSERAKLLNEQFGLGIPAGSQAIVELQYDRPGGNLMSANVITEPGSTPGSGEGSGPFGASLTGRTLEHFTNLAPSFGAARTTPEQERTFLTAVTNYLQPEQFQDPDTGLLVTKRNELPQYVRNALEARGFQVDSGTGSIQPPQGFTLQPQQDPRDQAVTQAAAQSTPTVPPEASIPPQDPGTPSIYEMFESGRATGVVPTIRRGLFRVTGDMFVNAAEETEVATFLNSIKEQLIDGLRRNPRFAEGEAKRKLEAVDLDPGLFRSAASGQAAAIGFDDVLREFEREMRDVVEGKRRLVSGETRQHAMDTLQILRHTRDIVAPPRVKPDELSQYVQTAAPGETILLDRGPGQRIPVRVFQRMQDAEAALENAQPGDWFYVNGQWFQAEEGQ